MSNTQSKRLENMLSVDEIASRLGIDKRSVWRLVALYEATEGREGIGPAHKLSHRVTRFFESSVVRWIESRSTVLPGKSA